MHKRNASLEIYERLCQVIPGGVNSPVRSCKGMGQPPMVAARGEGPYVYDADGNKFIDFCCSWGAIIHGHANPEIVSVAQKRVAMGSTFGITTEIEEKIARKIIHLMPSIEKIRFVSSGTEATMSAVRLARGYTKREMVLKFSGNYHGHADFFLVQAGSGVMSMCPESTSAGVPSEVVKHTLCVPYNDVEAVRKIFRDHGPKIACVILEPIAGNMGCVPASQEFLEVLREETSRHGSVLIFDEVFDGFRVAKGGAQSLYGIVPDMTTLAKIIGGGFPAAAFGGKREIMDLLAPLGPVYQAGTLSGNPVAMEAGLKALEMLERPGFYEELERKARLFIDPVRAWMKDNQYAGCIQQVGSMFTLFFGRREVRNGEEAKMCDMEKFAEYFRFMFAHGVYISPLQQEPLFVTSAHSDEDMIYFRDLTLKFLNQ